MRVYFFRPGRQALGLHSDRAEPMNHDPELPPNAPSPGDPAGLPAAGPKLPKIVRFADLAVCGDELWIENNGELYRLRRTRLGKLILTK